MAKRIEEAENLEELGKVESDMLNYQVLDPACGSGNFLYVAYRELRRLEHSCTRSGCCVVARSAVGRRCTLVRIAAQFHGIDLDRSRSRSPRSR